MNDKVEVFLMSVIILLSFVGIFAGGVSLYGHLQPKDPTLYIHKPIEAPEGFEFECVDNPSQERICYAYCGPTGEDPEGIEEPK